jgi:hypothetical protein
MLNGIQSPPLWGSILNIPAAVDTKEYISANQTLTAGGQLVLAHGLGVAPREVICYLINVTAEFGYSIGDVLIVDETMQTGTDRGLSVVIDATNITIRFGASAASFIILSKSSGTQQSAVNANWAMRVRARA